MKIKTYSLSIAVIAMLTCFSPRAFANSDAPVEDPKTELTDEEVAIRMAEMKRRVEEIKAIDRSNLTKQERKALRKELREMNKEARALGQGGVYLSVGAIIIIILLLILIL